MLVNFSEGAGEVLVQRSGVSAERQLTVEEIIARHQQQQRAQDALVRSYIAHARMDQHFRPTITDPGLRRRRPTTATSSPGRQVEWEELSLLRERHEVGRRPAAVPAAAAGEGAVAAAAAPLRRRLPLPAGRHGTRRRLRLLRRALRAGREAARRSTAGRSGSIGARSRASRCRRCRRRCRRRSCRTKRSRRSRRWRRSATAPVFLFTRLTARQIMLIAGRNLLVEKTRRVQRLPRNAGRTSRARADRGAARATQIMFRETDRGLRYFVKQGDDARRQRSVRPRARRRWRWGSTLDPSLRLPLPIFGINYLDFAFREPEHAARASCSRACWRRATSSVRKSGHAARRERRLLRDRRALERSRVRRGGRAPEGACPHLAAHYRPQSRLAVHAVPEADRAVSVPLRRLYARHDDVRRLRRAGEHDHQWLRRRLGIPPRRLQRRCVERRVVRAAGLARLGRARAQPTDFRAHLHEIQREPVARFLLQRLPEDSSERRLVRRPRSRSLCEVSVRHVRRHADPRRARVGRAIPGAGDGARLVLA